MKLETIKTCITALITFMICQIIFFTMNEVVAGLICMFGLSIIGLYIFRILNCIRDKIGESTNYGNIKIKNRKKESTNKES